MYYSYTTTTFALRAKWSFLNYDDFGLGIQSNPATCITCSQSSLYVSSRNPRFSYYSYLLKKSPNFCQLPRRAVTFRVCEERERLCNCRCFENNGFDVNFVEKDGICNKTRRNLVKSLSFFDDFEDNGDEYRKCCRKERLCNEKSNLLVKSDDGKKGVNDFRRHKDDRKFSKRLNKKANQELYCRRVKDEEESNDSENYLSSSRDFEDRRAKNVRKYADIDYSFSRDSKYETNGKVLDRIYSNEDGYSSKKKSTLSRDLESDRRDYSSKKNSTISSKLESRKLVGNKKGYGIERVDKEKVVQEIQRNKDDEASLSSWSRKETSVKDFDLKIREGEDKTAYSKKVSERNARNEQYVYDEQEDSRKLTRSQRDDRHNRSSVEESIDDCRKESYLHSELDSDTRYTNKGESSTSYMERQSEIGKQVIRQANLKENYLRSNNDVNMATSLTSVKNLVDVTRRTQIDQNETDNVYVNKLHETYNDDSRICNTNTSTSHTDSRKEDETILRSHRRMENETTRKESIASSVENQIRRDVISEMETIDQYTNQTNTSLIYNRGTEKANNEYTLETSGNTCLEIREDKQEGTTSDIDSSVSGFRRNDTEIISNFSEEPPIRTKNQQEASSSTTMHKKNDNKQKRSQSTAQIGTSSSVNQYKNDAIESARRLDESSSIYVGDFVNNLRQEASASDKHEKISGLRHEGEKQSSLRYRNKGPSDEMWEIHGTTSMESSKTKEAKNGSSKLEVSNVDTTAEVAPGNALTKRAHKSLWTYIADIMKIGLGHRSDTSTQKSGRSSSNASVGSEAYYSGEELDEDKVSTEKEKSFDRSTQVSHEGTDRRNITTEQPLLPLREGKSPLHGDTGKDIVHGSGLLKTKEEFDRQIIAGTSERHDDELEKKRRCPHLGGSTTSIPVIKSAFSSRGGDITSHGEESSIVTVDMTPPSVPEIESIHIPSSELPKLEETTNRAKSEGEMNRRNLQRSKQVLTTQFEEWEEAYTREREQRLIDELFMREALLEAKKAADSWEVPVGAVLVQNGKIIARGCNLVEELRDSTAHAEMICIRQASNILKSWRLAETTLYVTLEPCAMCAGAILQARVDTVVWGAPNKLLGADGSWVRLFPNGDGGTSGDTSTSTNQNVGPVHPFHPKITIRRGILATECSDTMQKFFQLRRKKVKKQESPPPRIPISTVPVRLLGRFHNLLAAMFCL